MNRYSLRTLLFAVVITALLVAWFREPLIRLIRSREIPWQLVETEQEFEEMISRKDAFVFVHVDWSFDSVAARRTVEEFVADWRWNNRGQEVDFFLIDNTRQDQDWFMKWEQSDGKLNCIHNGYGEAIWLQKGTVLDRMSGFGHVDAEVLTNRTKKLL